MVGIDVGGTHTDCVLLDPAAKVIRIAKISTTTGDPSVGFLQGLEWLGVPAADLEGIIHGTTVATNAVLERRGARCGLITTRGFRDVIELGRRIRENVYGLTGGFEPLIPRELRLEVAERMDAVGEVVTPLSEADVHAAIAALRQAEVEAILIHFMHAYTNPTHERRCRDLIRASWPAVDVTLGSEVLPQFREFERGIAGAVNAYVQPLIGHYVSQLETRLTGSGAAGRLQIMKSNGGMMSATMGRSNAAHLVLSGPAAGAVAAGRIAVEAGFKDAVACDMGGTSFDVTLIREGEPAITHEKELGYGLPLHLPMVDIHTIGAGGGSIAHVDAAGILRVGPESAGALPGPAAFRRGGRRATVTDANLLLGRMDPMAVNGVPAGADLAAAEAAMLRDVGSPLAMDALDAAEAVLAVANNAMAGAIRTAALSRGLDPRSLVLVAFGGAGALHACALARELAIPTVIVPRHPGLTSALGAAMADVRHDFVNAVGRSLSEVAARDATAVLETQAAEGRALLRTERLPLERVEVRHAADLLYAGQTHVVQVPVRDGRFDQDEIAKAFAARMVERLGFASRGLRPILVSLRTSVIGWRPRLDLTGFTTLEPESSPRNPPPSARPVRFGGRWTDTTIIQRSALQTGDEVSGPCVIVQMDATTLLHQGDHAVVDAFGNIVVQVA
ncbi:MAG: hydantoinase/oxoprolinase family protein [Cupriavidus sp.]|nr:hydantoinase/oxoprolinase family protein [Cupriavidus sp.]MCA3705032.1 hydantoinase/oxoprolinase family protein [Methylobacterium sp.]